MSWDWKNLKANVNTHVLSQDTVIYSDLHIDRKKDSSIDIATLLKTTFSPVKSQ